MKTCAVFLTFCVIGAFAPPPSFLTYKADCMTAAQMDASYSTTCDKLMNGEVISEPDEKVNCFAQCLLKKYHLIKDDDSFDENTALTIANSEKAKKAVEECKSSKGADACQTAGKIYNCFNSHKVPPGPTLQ